MRAASPAACMTAAARLLLALSLLAAAAVRAAPESLPVSTPVQAVRDLAYGGEPLEHIDAYVPLHPAGPVLLMVHGGAWAFGDKASAAMIRPKVAYWGARGYVVVSVNYPLLPAADPMEQALDVARALALVQQKAASWGADGQRVVLMGHSSGGHLVSLLNAAPRLAYAQGAKPWRGTVNLDGAALDVPELMRARHAPLFDRAFGRDPAFWDSVSPLHVLQRQPAPPPLLLVCSSLRGRSCPQAEALARKATAWGHQVSVRAEPASHSEIDRQLGLPGAYTDSVARWISSIL
ncbi:MAG: esterase [Ramlibacter sp.]|nr:esterase [Ramlibacter sp.]